MRSGISVHEAQHGTDRGSPWKGERWGTKQDKANDKCCRQKGLLTARGNGSHRPAKARHPAISQCQE